MALLAFPLLLSWVARPPPEVAPLVRTCAPVSASPMTSQLQPFLPSVRLRASAVRMQLAFPAHAEHRGAVAAARAPRTASDWRVLLSLCIGDWPLLLAALLALTLAATGDALIPQLQSEALNVLLYTEAVAMRPRLLVSLAKLASVGVLTALFTGVRGFLFWLSGARLVKRLRVALFASLLAKPQSFYDTRGTGELGSRLNADCIKLSDVLSLNVNIVLRQIMQSVVGITIVARLNRQLALIVLTGVSVRGALNYAYAAFNKRVAKAQQAALAESAAVADQSLSLVQVVRAHGTQEYEQERYESQLSRLLSLQTTQGALYGVSRVVNGALNTFLLCGVMAYGGALVVAGILPAKMMTSFVFYTEFIGSASFDVADQWRSIQEAMGAASEVFALLRAETTTSRPNATTAFAASTTPEQEVAKSSKRGQLEIDQVRFAYPSRSSEQVLDGLSVSIPAGSSVAVVGSSGGGKSTIFKLVLRFYEPTAGSIRLDGEELETIPETELRRLVAWVPQEPPLFGNVTIAENIAYGLNASMEQIVAAAREANCHKFISALPHGYQTRLGASGASLSGGQKQRVAIARALVRNPSLLLLDEATSALDTESAREIESALRRASIQRTVMFTTHKVDQARKADLILVIANGVVAEQGSHDELRARRGLYFDLLSRENAFEGVPSTQEPRELQRGGADYGQL
ncbi:hypothetical protein AB1Y20_001534 [Prymnesium parvum]|uniref:ATP-dependent transporter ycf16 n=1 Tax=Prymnesium parvum TaxID=97485 RepID=A0AB34KDK4_PRYPA